MSVKTYFDVLSAMHMALVELVSFYGEKKDKWAVLRLNDGTVLELNTFTGTVYHKKGMGEYVGGIIGFKGDVIKKLGRVISGNSSSKRLGQEYIIILGTILRTVGTDEAARYTKRVRKKWLDYYQDK